EARRPARIGERGEIIPLPEQDRSRWDRSLAAEGLILLDACTRGQPLGPYQIQAAISAVHMSAASSAETDWDRIVRLYDLLLAIKPNPVVQLNRAVAVAEVQGPDAALETLRACEGLEHYYLYHAIRADLLQRGGRIADAIAAYDAAIARAENGVEREFLERKRASAAARSSKRQEKGVRARRPV